MMKNVIRSLAFALLAGTCAAGCSAPSKVEQMTEHFQRLETLLADHVEAERSGDPEKIRQSSGAIADLAGSIAEDLCWACEFETDRRRAIAAAALGFVRKADVVQHLVAATKDSHADVRCNAAGSLGRLEDAQTPLQPLAELLGDKDPHVRSAALFALFNLLPDGNDGGCYEQIVKHLGDAHAAVRNHALLALRKAGNPDAVRPIAETLMTDREAVIRENAALAVGALLGRDNGIRMTKLAREEGPEPEKAVAELDERFNQLRKIVNPPLIDLLKDDKPSVVRAAAHALRQVNVGEDHGRSYAYWRAWWEMVEKRSAPTKDILPPATNPIKGVDQPAPETPPIPPPEPPPAPPDSQ